MVKNTEHYSMDDFFKSMINDKTTQVNDIKLNGFDSTINGINITLQGANAALKGFMKTESEESPCAHCPNNPAVNKFASGICHCILAVPTIF